jgi:tRNA (guanine-N7-)-methyltransferase
VGKNKLSKFADLNTYEHVVQISYKKLLAEEFKYKGKWSELFFGNSNPVVLELGCGKGEYTVRLAAMYPQKNFIGIDIKGARMWKGAKESHLMKQPNATFLRTRIELLGSFFAAGETEEIWLTFPDPQPKWKREKKRLPGPVFLNLYRSFLKDNGIVHLKTDSRELYDYTLSLVQVNRLEIITSVTDLHGQMPGDPLLSIRTHYEEIFLKQGILITYLAFRLPNEKEIVSPGQ